MAARRYHQNHQSMTEMPNITEAEEVGYFSVSENKQYFDKRCLRYFVSPSNPNDVEFDLNHGYDTFIKQSRMIDLDYILRCIRVNRYKPQSCPSGIPPSLVTDFVCQKRFLLCLMESSWLSANLKYWETYVTLYKGTYYIGEKVGAQIKLEDEIMDWMYWMWCYPKYITAAEPYGTPDIDRPVKNGDIFYSMVTRRIGNHSILFTCGIDCIDDQDQYVELGINRIFRDKRDEHNFNRFKLRSWWSRNFLNSIPKIIAGIRDEDGIIRSVKTYKTNDLPRMASKGLPEWSKWDPAVSVNYVNRFFDFVKSHVVEDDAECVYLVTCKPGEYMDCQRLEPGTCGQILPDWYIEEVK